MALQWPRGAQNEANGDDLLISWVGLFFPSEQECGEGGSGAFHGNKEWVDPHPLTHTATLFKLNCSSYVLLLVRIEDKGNRL